MSMSPIVVQWTSHRIPLASARWAILSVPVMPAFQETSARTISTAPKRIAWATPHGPPRVVSIAAYEAAFEPCDSSLASAIAMIMGFVQLVIVAAVLGLRNAFYRGPVVGGKG